MQNVGFLNLHGARKCGKWEELYKVLHDESMMVYAVAETHLIGDEEPPIHPHWHWSGQNRAPNGRKGGGIGLLWRAGTSWTRLDCPCSEHMWATGDILGIPVLLGVAYLAVDRGHNTGNAQVMQCIREDVGRWAADKEVLLLGDFNGHIQPLDGYQDPNGDLMLQTAQQLSLEVLNLRPDCEGEFTWCARSSRSCIDYALVSHKLARHVQHVHIDEAGQFSVSSDHNRIKVSFTTSAWRERRREQREPSRRFLPASAYEAVAQELRPNHKHA